MALSLHFNARGMLKPVRLEKRFTWWSYFPPPAWVPSFIRSIVAQLLLLQSQHRQVVQHHMGAPLKRSVFTLLVDRGDVRSSVKKNAASASATMRKRVVRYRIRGSVDIYFVKDEVFKHL
jgi:hypothetical protein